MKRFLKISAAGVVAVPSASFGYWYLIAATDRQRTCVRDAGTQLPDILQGGATRFARSAWSGLLLSLDYKWSLRGLDDDSEEYADTISQVHLRAANRILGACLSNTGLYIKFGQGLVAMNHVLPKEYTETLKILQDKCLRRQSDGEIDEMFMQDLGQTPDQLFKEFDREPIAAASLAQVFKATTDAGKRVAVKVQYADLRERFDSDVATFAAILDMIEVMHPKFGFRWVLDELKDNMASELDFEKEGQNAERCGRDLGHLKFVYVPKVFWNRCSKRILTTEFIDGIKISHTDELKYGGYDVSVIGQRLIKVFAEQVFHSGFVHADPHPGNLLVRGPKVSPQIVLLDHGLYETIPIETRQSLARVWQAVVENNHVDMKKYSAKLGIEDYRLFCMAVTQRYVGFAPGEKLDYLAEFLESRGKGFKGLTKTEFKKLPEEEKAKLRLAIRDTHDKLLDVFQNVPSKLMLVFRNLNIIRSIIRDHGSRVDRHRIMARVAVKGYFVKPDAGLFSRMLGSIHLLMFDMRLAADWAKTTLAKFTIVIMKYIGYFSIDMFASKAIET